MQSGPPESAGFLGPTSLVLPPAPRRKSYGRQTFGVFEKSVEESTRACTHEEELRRSELGFEAPKGVS